MIRIENTGEDQFAKFDEDRKDWYRLVCYDSFRLIVPEQPDLSQIRSAIFPVLLLQLFHVILFCLVARDAINLLIYMRTLLDDAYQWRLFLVTDCVQL